MTTLTALSVTALDVFSWIGYFLIALLSLMFMIIIHESGHYIAGKALGFKIEEFSIGFGPAIFKRKNKKNGELFAIRALPLGGYCAFSGENEDGVEQVGSFNAQKPWKRIIVFVAGAFFNFVSAIILIAIFFMAYGDYMPKIGNTAQLVNGKEHVLQIDDMILQVNGNSVYSMFDQKAFAKALEKNGDKAELTVLRGGEKLKIAVEKTDYYAVDENGEFLLDNAGNRVVNNGYGIMYGFERYKFDFFYSFGRAFIFIFKIIGVLFSTIGGVFTGALGLKESLGGTATAIGMIMNMTKSGFDGLMYVVCVMSATLSVMNMLPLPALDGSKVVFTTIEWVRGKPINRRVENSIHFVGLILLFGFAILLDLIHFLS